MVLQLAGWWMYNSNRWGERSWCPLSKTDAILVLRLHVLLLFAVMFCSAFFGDLFQNPFPHCFPHNVLTALLLFSYFLIADYLMHGVGFAIRPPLHRSPCDMTTHIRRLLAYFSAIKNTTSMYCGTVRGCDRKLYSSPGCGRLVPAIENSGWTSCIRCKCRCICYVFGM